ncbi:hypothetical protein [Nocardioides sp. GXZ039]|uniref:hypothetical protein n=1 Tax=Nocardioides sp. GXZ039 TaxID=3136018 RepID=UPI0030F4154B
MCRALTAVLALTLATFTLTATGTGAATAEDAPTLGRIDRDGPPIAARSIHRDRVGDAGSQYDTHQIVLYPAYRGWVAVQAYSNTYDVGPKFNGMDISYDTKGGRAADYRLIWDFRNDGDGHQRFVLLRVNGSDAISRVNCPSLTGKGRPRINAIEVLVPRNCMRIRKKVGVQVQTWDYTRYRKGNPVRGYRDKAPNRGWLR